MARIKLQISYDGTDFCGWQKQTLHQFGPSKPSIQESLELSLEKIFKHPIDLCASGRTDAGVHALSQIAHFDTLNPQEKWPKDLCWALRSNLPPSIVVRNAWLAPNDFHSTLSAEKKTYRFWIWNHLRSSALLSRYSHWIRKPLDLNFLNEAASYLIKKQDFESFRSKGTPVVHTVREIYSANWRLLRPPLVEFQITGNGFLKQMVRNVVGTQLELFFNREPPSTMKMILEARSRPAAGFAAPPNGLFLVRVYYPKRLDNQCRQL